MAKFIVAAVGLMILGIFLMSPAFWSNPKFPTLLDLLPGIFAMLIGLGLLVLILLPILVPLWSATAADPPGVAQPQQSPVQSIPTDQRSDVP
jgi:hypothetical protein